MRLAIFAPLVLGLSACSTADQTAQESGNAVASTGAAVANAVEQGADSLGNTVSDIAAPVDRNAWIGRWIGVEGTYLVIAKGDGPGRYKLEMQYTLDDKGSFEGTGRDAGIAFRRPDGAQVLRATDGVATGLKYLAGKKDCLTVKPGEGYCRG
ncbi:hypothetical protein [Sphingomonas gei]|uniref:hypothetical protein n=1 Tax=Sphingomonas gei TaxID=1395960 RepID=UPI0019D16042|nr:hypothetical protein [Sphingomonas gei]